MANKKDPKAPLDPVSMPHPRQNIKAINVIKRLFLNIKRSFKTNIDTMYAMGATTMS